LAGITADLLLRHLRTPAERQHKDAMGWPDRNPAPKTPDRTGDPPPMPFGLIDRNVNLFIALLVQMA
jgi:hypothetical protein